MSPVPVTKELLAAIERCSGAVFRKTASDEHAFQEELDKYDEKIRRMVEHSLEQSRQDVDMIDGWLKRAKEALK